MDDDFDACALFDELNITIPDQRASPSEKQKMILHINGVRPSEYSAGFSNTADMNAFVSDRVEEGRAFQNRWGAQPMDGVLKELFEDWNLQIDVDTLTKKDSIQLLKRHAGHNIRLPSFGRPK